MAGDVVVTPVVSALASIYTSVAFAIPQIIASVILLVLGFVIGKVVGSAVKEVLLRSKVDEHVQIKNQQLRFSNLFSEVIKWIIYLLFIEQAAAKVGLTAVAAAFGSLVMFLPSVIQAIIVVAVGYVIARYLEEAVRDTRISYSGLMSKLFFFIVVYVTIAIALPLVGISGRLLEAILLIIVGSMGLGFAIAMGLGLKGFFSDVSHELSKNVLKGIKTKK